MKKLMILISLPLLFIFACKKPESVTIIPDTGYFPNTVGDFWQYSRYDSTTDIEDIVFIRITGETTLNGETYHTWEYQFPDDTIVYNVIGHNDSVIMYNAVSHMIDELYLVPFEAGAGWNLPKVNATIDTFYVAGIQNLDIGSNTYKNTALIKHSSGAFNEYTNENIWIMPYLGMVKRDIKVHRFNSLRNETWTLVNYHVE